jgi:hypothetical protein
VILRRHVASAWLEWLVPLGVSFAFFPLGLRAEALAGALTMTGFAVADAGAGRKNYGWLFTGFFLIFLGASTAPRMTVFSGALGLYVLYAALQTATGKNRWQILFLWLGAVALAGLIFLYLIDFKLGEFLHAFRFFAAGRVYKSKLRLVANYLFAYLGYLQMLIVLIPLGLLACSVGKTKDGLSKPAWFIAAALPLSVLIGGLGSGTAWWTFLMMVLLAGSLLKNLARRRAVARLGFIILTMLIINRKMLVQTGGILAGKIKPDRGEVLPEVFSLKPTAEHPILLDGWVARYVYDYRLPEGALDFASATKFPGMTPGFYSLPASYGPQLRPGDLYVLGNEMLVNLKTYTYFEHASNPKWSFCGLKQLAFEEYPRWVFIVPSESCRGLRLDAAVAMPDAK